MTDLLPMTTVASRPRPNSAPRAGDTPKSRRTRARILDAAARLVAEVGYARADAAEIAAGAGLTRGAMLYHFPTRETLTRALADHLQHERARAFESAAGASVGTGDAIERAVDVYWRLLGTPAFRAFAALEHAASADETLAEMIRPAQEAFDRAAFGGGGSAALLQAGAAPRFQASRDLARFALEGMARAELTYDDEARVRRLLDVLKRAAHMLNRKGDVHELWPES